MLIQITRSCGHQEWVRSKAPLYLRASVVARESQKLCPECYAAQRVAQAQQVVQSQSLPQRLCRIHVSPPVTDNG